MLLGLGGIVVVTTAAARAKQGRGRKCQNDIVGFHSISISVLDAISGKFDASIFFWLFLA